MVIVWNYGPRNQQQFQVFTGSPYMFIWAGTLGASALTNLQLNRGGGRTFAGRAVTVTRPVRIGGR